MSDDCRWIHWNEMVPEFEYPSDRVLEYHTILVPNVDNTRTMFLLDIIAKQGKAVLLIGKYIFNIGVNAFSSVEYVT